MRAACADKQRWCVGLQRERMARAVREAVQEVARHSHVVEERGEGCHHRVSGSTGALRFEIPECTLLPPREAVASRHGGWEQRHKAVAMRTPCDRHVGEVDVLAGTKPAKEVRDRHRPAPAHWHLQVFIEIVLQEVY